MSGFVGHGRDQVTDPGELVPVEDHLAAILRLLPSVEPISLRLVDALGLILAEDLESTATVPSFASSAMDGYAIVAADLEEASADAPVRLPVVGEIAAGAVPAEALRPGQALRIMTGAPIPDGADTVVPVELTTGDDREAAFHRPATVGDNVRGAGEDVVAGQPLLTRGRRISPADIALLATAGISQVQSMPPPRVVVMSTGDELVRADREPGPGQIRDTNGPMLTAMVRAAGGVPFSAGIVPDDRKKLMNAFDTNSGHADLFVCTGGASAGTRDLLPDVIGALGEVTTAKVAMRPGMPQIRGRIRNVPVIGLPGNPVSAFVSFEVFVRPVIRHLQGRRDTSRPQVRAIATAPLTAPEHKRGYVRVSLKRDGARWLATPTGAQGSHLVSSIARADGLAIVPEDTTRIPEGGDVAVHLLVD
jgi:molybdopterin molybdotransferase